MVYEFIEAVGTVNDLFAVKLKNGQHVLAGTYAEMRTKVKDLAKHLGFNQDKACREWYRSFIEAQLNGMPVRHIV